MSAAKRMKLDEAVSSSSYDEDSDDGTEYTSDTDVDGERDLDSEDDGSGEETDVDYESDGFVVKDEDENDDELMAGSVADKRILDETDDQFEKRWDVIFDRLEKEFTAKGSRMTQGKYDAKLALLENQHYGEAVAIQAHRKRNAKRGKSAAAAGLAGGAARTSAMPLPKPLAAKARSPSPARRTLPSSATASKPATTAAPPAHRPPPAHAAGPQRPVATAHPPRPAAAGSGAPVRQVVHRPVLKTTAPGASGPSSTYQPSSSQYKFAHAPNHRG